MLGTPECIKLIMVALTEVQEHMSIAEEIIVYNDIIVLSIRRHVIYNHLKTMSKSIPSKNQAALCNHSINKKVLLWESRQYFPEKLLQCFAETELLIVQESNIVFLPYRVHVFHHYLTCASSLHCDCVQHQHILHMKWKII